MKRSSLLLRSMLFVPGHSEHLLMSAARTDADALIPDVEDSVMPVSNKRVAREGILEAVAAGLFGDRPIFPRINDRESGFLLKDVAALTVEGIAGFVYPKALMGQDIYFFDKLLETIEAEKGFPKGKFKIVPLIETAAAVLNAQQICLASERVVAIAYGCEDFISNLEGVHDREGKSLYVARAMIAMAARATGVIPIDTVHIEVHDLEGLERNLALARTLGFEGMLILHPKEIALAHRFFSPSEKEVEDARTMLRLAEEAQGRDKGVAIIDGRFIAPPMIRIARGILERDALIARRAAAIAERPPRASGQRMG